MKTERCMKDNGNSIKPMDGADSFKANGDFYEGQWDDDQHSG